MWVTMKFEDGTIKTEHCDGYEFYEDKKECHVHSGNPIDMFSYYSSHTYTNVVEVW